jgi:5,10-methylenetetrahydrofolate reductase/predicted  nucleic acid-binding Zn-ribbon protein
MSGKRIVFPHATPAYFAEFAAQARALGARLIGGCCGTTPTEIAAIRAAIDENREPAGPLRVRERELLIAPEGEQHETELQRMLGAGEFVVSVQLDPPLGGNHQAMLEASRELQASEHVHIVDVNDNPRARARMSGMMASIAIERLCGIETIPHQTSRDTTIAGLESILLGAHAEGIRNVLAVTGDPPEVGDYPGSQGVYEVDAIGLVDVIARLNSGEDYYGRAIDAPTSFFPGVAVNPSADDLDTELERFERKLEAGARFAMTQILFDLSYLERFLAHYGGTSPVPLLVGLWPIRSFELAQRVHNEVPGIVVPEEVQERLRTAGADSPRVGLALTRDLLAQARDLETRSATDRRRAEEQERAAASRADAAGRETAWLSSQVSRLQAEAARLRAAVPPVAAEGPVAALPGDVPAPAVAAAAQPARSDAAARDRIAALQRRRDALARDVDVARSARATAERKRAAAEAAVALGERQLAYAARMAGDLAEREARLAAEREDLKAAMADTDRAVREAEAALASVVGATRGERERLRAAELEVAGIRERARIAQERTRIAERDDIEARLAAEALREQLIVELAGLGATAIRHLRGEDGVPTTPDDDPDPEALESAIDVAATIWHATPPPAEAPSPARLAGLRRRFHDLGAVNPFAADEYADVRTRLDGLEAQRTDIQTAIERTRELIAELDKLVSEQFRRTFEALEKAFDQRFRQLFGGGFAKLALTDPQDLAATGIEITARPPGKKAQALAMLSGGERALTAVALLFAMLEVRPVPFCVLDEVDAALDEANIGRFTDALRDLSKATQCIVITHNRGTIEAADALYGVTVGDDSVSRVISLRLEEATALAARSSASRTGIPVALGIGDE